MTRFVCGILILGTLAGALQAQGSKYTPVQGGTRDPEALKKLAAILSSGDALSQAEPVIPEALKQAFKNASPEQRQAMIEAAQRQIRENPEQFKNFKPNYSDEYVKKLQESLGKPGDPLPQLPMPGDRPQPPLLPQPPVPQPRPVDPQQPFNPQPMPQPPPFPQPPKLRPGQPDPNSEQVKGAVQAWEQTVGPIDSTPAVKDAIVDLFGNGTGGPNEKPFWDGLDGSSGGSSSSSSNSGFWKFLNGGSGTGGSNWNTPSWLKNFSAGSAPSAPSAPKTGLSGPTMPGIGGLGGVGIAGLGTVGTVILILIVAAVVGFLLWKFLPMIQEARNRRLQPLPGQGPWPVDPRTIRDREALVIAFEYLSILVCGDGAVVWNHMTIAEALRGALPDREHLAEPLARLYAVARYTPIREEIPESAYAEARRCLCALAGVSER